MSEPLQDVLILLTGWLIGAGITAFFWWKLGFGAGR